MNSVLISVLSSMLNLLLHSLLLRTESNEKSIIICNFVALHKCHLLYYCCFLFFSITDFELFDYDVPWYSFRNVYLWVGYGWMIFTFLESVGM